MICRTYRRPVRGIAARALAVLKLLIRFYDAFSAMARLCDQARAVEVVNANFNAEMDKGMTKAMGSARP